MKKNSELVLIEKKIEKIEERAAKNLRKAWVDDGEWEELYANHKRYWNQVKSEIEKIYAQ